MTQVRRAEDKRNELFSLIGPSVRLAHGGHVAAIKALQTIDDWMAPPLLVSYVWVDAFIESMKKDNLKMRDWVMDSGAYSAFNSGKIIYIDQFIEKCQEVMSSDPLLTEIFALDVIGDWRAGLKNCEKMWENDVPAIPCFHFGEPEDVLLHIAENYPKIAIGGMVGIKREKKLAFIKECFARVWPKKIHGFGVGSETGILNVPWHSVDASSWNTGPCKFGNWRLFGKMSVRGDHDLTSEIQYYMKLEMKARQKWKKQMIELKTLEPTEPTTIKEKK